MDLSPLKLLESKTENLFLCLSIFLSLLVSILYLHKKILGQNSKLPPSPPRLPLIGNLHQLGKVPHHSLRALSDKYGPILYLKLGQVPTLLISSPDIVKEIVQSHDVIFSSRPKTLASDILFYEGKDIGFAAYGDYWRKARKLCTVELFSLKRVQSFQHVREEEVKELVEKVRKACADNSGVAINLSQVLIETTKDIVCRCLLGQSYRKEDGSGGKIKKLLNAVLAQLLSLSVGEFFPFLKWVDVVSGLVGRMRSTSTEFQGLLDRVIQEHEASSGPGSDNAKDFVDVLLQIQQDSTSDFEITLTHLKGIMQDMFVGGIESTSSMTEWIMVELLRHPVAMKKAQNEVRKIAAEEGKIDMNVISKMIFLKNVVKETLRLHPPAPLLVPRETTSSTQIGPYEIPAKTRVLVNAWAIQRDPSLWNDPEEFFPERFENNSPDQDFRFIPFGFGRRICPGMTFGLFSIEYVIANLLYAFDWKYPEDNGSVKDMDMSETYGLAVHKKIPLHVVPIPFFP